jgi:integrase
MARKRERGNGDGDVWPRKNKQGKIIGYRASYWVDTPSGPKWRYVSGKNKGETRAVLSKAKAGKEDGFVPDAGATLLLIKGVHPKYVQELLGHADISITLDTYSHVIPGMGNQTVDAMEEIFT